MWNLGHNFASRILRNGCIWFVRALNDQRHPLDSIRGYMWNVWESSISKYKRKCTLFLLWNTLKSMILAIFSGNRAWITKTQKERNKSKRCINVSRFLASEVSASKIREDYRLINVTKIFLKSDYIDLLWTYKMITLLMKKLSCITLKVVVQNSYGMFTIYYYF